MENPGPQAGARRAAGRLAALRRRRAPPPGAGRAAGRAPPAGHDADPHPARRPRVRLGDGPLARPAGPGGPPGLAPRAVVGAGAAAVPVSRKHLPARLARLRELDGQHPALVRGQGTEFDSLREYVVGDDVRSIDWRATARRHDVVVRTWRPERDRRVLIVLDTGRTSAGRVGDAPIPLAGAATARRAAGQAGHATGARLAAAGLVDGRGAAAGRARRPGRRPGRLPRLRPGGARLGVRRLAYGAAVVAGQRAWRRSRPS